MHARKMNDTEFKNTFLDYYSIDITVRKKDIPDHLLTKYNNEGRRQIVRELLDTKDLSIGESRASQQARQLLLTTFSIALRVFTYYESLQSLVTDGSNEERLICIDFLVVYVDKFYLNTGQKNLSQQRLRKLPSSPFFVFISGTLYNKLKGLLALFVAAIHVDYDYFKTIKDSKKTKVIIVDLTYNSLYKSWNKKQNNIIIRIKVDTNASRRAFLKECNLNILAKSSRAINNFVVRKNKASN